jgi:hypothetical protein
LALEYLFERDKTLGAGQAEGLQFLVDDVEHVAVVTCIELDEHVILAGSEVTLYNFGYLFELFYYAREVAGGL